MKKFLLRLLMSGLFVLTAVGVWAGAKLPRQIVWRFNRLDRIGGAAAHAEGRPQTVATPAGQAVALNGVDDVLFVDRHPLAGAETFTIEAVFRPDGGAFEQRWLHLSEIDPATGQDSDARILFEIRVEGDRWYLDAFANGPGYKQTLIAPEKTFPVGRWYRVEQTYDGKMYRSYVDGVLQAEAPFEFKPQGQGHTSLGMRINRVTPFKGAILKIRFTPRALAPDQFMPLPGGLNEPGK
jgi:hypothetical protein